MKKSAKPLLITLLLFLVVATGIILTSVGIKLKYEELTRNKNDFEKILKTERLHRINLTADIQMLTEEDRIVQLAGTDLGLIRRIKPTLQIIASKEKINEISKILSDKYE